MDEEVKFGPLRANKSSHRICINDPKLSLSYGQEQDLLGHLDRSLEVDRSSELVCSTPPSLFKKQANKITISSNRAEQ